MSEIMVYRADDYWQRACVNSIRVDVCIKELKIDPRVEFDKYDHNNSMYILAMDGNTPVGTCRLRFMEDEHVAKIERVNVIREYRGSGTGRALISAAEEWAASEGYLDIVITSREEAIGFYEKNGYTAHQDQKYQSSVYVVVPMTKRLEENR